MFELIDNTLCVPAKVLYDDLELCSYDNYKKMVVRDKLKLVVRGGNGRRAMIDYASMPEDLRMRIRKNCAGKSPYELALQNRIKTLIEQDLNALEYFNGYVKPDGEPLSVEKRREYNANANVLNAIDLFIKTKNAWRRTMGGRKQNMWDAISEMVNDIRSDEIPHNLPKKPRPLRNKFDRYMKESYPSLVHGGTGNANTEKLTPVAKAWLLARWASPIEKLTMTQLWEEFNSLADERGWKAVDDQKTIRNYIYQPEIKEQWYGHRYGELKAKEKYGYQHSTKLPTMRDSLWYSDGTKLNLFYMEDGKIQTTQVYEVMDAYSEVFLGYHVSKSEDFSAQFSAFKMAVQFSGHRPYECRYDNQGGHKKLQSGDFLTKLSHLSIRTQPYNGKSKTIESAFGRFQQHFLNRKWSFTGQNITAKKLESKANLEFILANKHMLPSYNEMMAEYVKLRNEWNHAPHPLTGRPRIEMYLESHNPKAPAIGFIEMVDLFWIQRDNTVMYTAYGLTITEKKRKHTYVKYDENRMPDMKWHRSNIDRKFIVKFDPEDMSTICVFKETPTGLQYVTILDEKITVHRGKQEAEAHEASFLAQVNNANKAARIATRDKTNEVLEQFNLLPEQHGLVSPALKGIESAKRNPKKQKRKVAKIDIGEIEKAISNEVPDLNDEEKLYSKLY
ncbi:DDE-type integrase/transposase/recombinase [Alkaliflexus imshenetskii]|uniref:DDE-type integrase/transposase/recombinase n=1 Tax=Alkaliflexus imshenetskii TaxID=286730 RepID=UPI000694AFB3|nr:DDE-type integrase/transposase/recombinase [Alkaliflexus imshenetskii]